MLHTVSLFNDYSELLDVVSEFDVHNPVPLQTLWLHVQHLEAKTVASVIVDNVRDLLVLLDEYRRSYKSESKDQVKLRQKLLDKMLSLIKEINLSGTVSAERFCTMYKDYEDLKEQGCKICTVCGTRQPAKKL